MSSPFIILLFTLFIYILALITFNKARKKFEGGKVGDVINLILVTIVLLFVSDYILILDNILSEEMIFILQHLTKVAALSFLTFGGIKISGE